MDELFGNDPPKKPKQNTQIKQIYKNKEKKVKKNRGKKKQKQQIIIEQKKKEEQSQSLQIPLIIKLHHNLLKTQKMEMSLEDFIQFMYPPQHKINLKKQIIRSFQKQDDEGNIQYKLKLIKPSNDRLDHLATQMKFRVNEGSGQAYYRIGVEDDGKVIGLDKSQMYQSLKTICTLANKVRMDVTALRISEGIKGIIVELMIRKNQKQGIKLQIRLLLFGEPGSGKSTLLGVLTSGENDNGKGYTRSKVFTHKHQLMSGITQTTSHHVIGFDSKGKLYNNNSMMSMESWLQNSSKLLSFIDVGGHKEKQVVSSLCSFFPQYALWVISGINVNLTTNNLELAKIFNLPLIVVITHLDKMSKQVQMQAVLKVKKILKNLYKQKTASVIKQMQQTVLFSRITSTEQVIPIFLISSVTGQNIELLINFFNLLTSVSELRNNQDLHSEFLISYKYIFDNNIVLAGTVIKGQIKKGQILHLGPDLKGTFRAVQVVSIQCMRVPVKIVKCGQLCTIGIKLLSYAKQWLQKQPNAIRRGMVLIDSKRNPKAANQFSAQFITYGNSSQKISPKYEPVINTQTTRQICHIVTLNQEQIQSQQNVSSIKLVQKKSKSIDMGQKSKTHHNSSLTLMKNQKLQIQIKKIKKQGKLKHKQSIDVLDSSELKKKKGNNLEPILQNKIKKKKQKDTYIYFDNNQSKTLRLRFKYYPQYLQIGQKLVINQMKLIGKVNKIFY